MRTFVLYILHFHNKYQTSQDTSTNALILGSHYEITFYSQKPYNLHSNTQYYMLKFSHQMFTTGTIYI